MGRLMTEAELREADRIKDDDINVLRAQLAMYGFNLTDTLLARYRTLTGLLHALGLNAGAKTAIIMAVGDARWRRKVARRRRSRTLRRV